MRKARLPSFALSWSSTSISFSLSAHGASSLPDWSSHCCDISAFMGNRKSGAFPLFPCALSVLSGVVCPGPSLFHHTPFAWRGEYRVQLR
ncbi:hypothetical protein ACFH8J_004105, partial [Salmonella enterica]